MLSVSNFHSETADETTLCKQGMKIQKVKLNGQPYLNKEEQKLLIDDEEPYRLFTFTIDL